MRVAEISTRFLAFGLGQGGFLAFVFGNFFFSVGVRVARSEHGIGLGSLTLFLAQTSKFITDLAQRGIYCFHFDEQVTDFLQKIVQVVGANDVGELGLFERPDVLAARHFRNKKETAHAAAFVNGNRGEFAQHVVAGRIKAEQSNIGDDQRPDADAHFGEELTAVGGNADAPAFRIEDLAESHGAGPFLVEDQDIDWTGF